MNQIRLQVLLSFLIFTQTLFAQITPPCPFPWQPGADDCSNACIYCDFNGYTGVNDGTPSQIPTVCGQIVLHNERWYGFTAGTNSISITVVPNNCLLGDGLQTAFFDHCGVQDAIACNPGTGGGGQTPLLLTYDSFTVGQTYYLMVDGWIDDVCEFTIDVTEGSITPPAPATPSQIQGPTVICAGLQAVYQIEAASDAGYYQWTAPPGADINGMGASVAIDAAIGTTVTVTFGNAPGDVCVQSGKNCNPLSTASCISVVSNPVPPTVLPQLTLCANELPYVWTEEPFPSLNEPGSYNLSSTYASFMGCDSIVEQSVLIRAPISVVDTNFVCPKGACYALGDSLYCSPGTYSQSFLTVDGCDSVVTVTLLGISPAAAIIQTPQGKTITCSIPILTLQSQNLPPVSHLWKNMAGDTLGTGSSIQVNTPNLYTHEVKTSTGCVAQAKVLIKQDTAPPQISAQGGTIDAQNPTVQLKGNSIISGVTYSWVGPNGYTSNKKNPVVSMPGFYTLTVTNPATGCSNSITVEVLLMT